LYKATIVSRGGSLGATFYLPSEADQVSISKNTIIAMIDCAMGGHIAEEMIMGDNNLTSGCSSDLKTATDLAIRAVRQFGMFGDDGGSFLSTEKKDTSDEFSQVVD
jgi:ATP-dependent metalloprotease